MDKLLYPLTTEKTTRLLEENKIVFIVDLKATKKEIKKEFETEFNVKVDKVNVLITPKGKKKAIITLNKKYNAYDIATKLGIM